MCAIKKLIKIKKFKCIKEIEINNMEKIII